MGERLVQIVPLRRVADYEAMGWVLCDNDLRNLGVRAGTHAALMEPPKRPLVGGEKDDG